MVWLWGMIAGATIMAYKNDFPIVTKANLSNCREILDSLEKFERWTELQANSLSLVPFYLQLCILNLKGSLSDVLESMNPKNGGCRCLYKWWINPQGLI